MATLRNRGSQQQNRNYYSQGGSQGNLAYDLNKAPTHRDRGGSYNNRNSNNGNYDNRNYDSRNYDNRNSSNRNSSNRNINSRSYDNRNYDNRNSYDSRNYDNRNSNSRSYDNRNSYDSRNSSNRNINSRSYDNRNSYDSRNYDNRNSNSRNYDNRNYNNRNYDNRISTNKDVRNNNIVPRDTKKQDYSKAKQAEAKPRSNPKERVSIRQKVKVNYSVMTSYHWKSGIIAIFIFIGAIAFVGSKVQVDNINVSIRQNREQLKNIKEQNAILNAERMKEIDLEYVRNEAMSRLNMSEPQAHQIIHINVPKQSYTIQHDSGS